MDKIIFIHNNVPDRSSFISFINQDIGIYEELNDINISTNLDTNNINRIGFVWHNNGVIKIPFFDEINEEHFFKNFTNLKYIDLITHDIYTLDWYEYINNIEKSLLKYNIETTIRYSIKQSGDGIKTDWILDSDDINLIDENIYFGESMLNYKYILNENIQINTEKELYRNIFSRDNHLTTLPPTTCPTILPPVFLQEALSNIYIIDYDEVKSFSWCYGYLIGS
jgi:hypothetical protein